MKNLTLAKTAIFIAITGFISFNLNAQALYPVALTEKVQQSAIIAEGKVEEQFSFWNPAHTMIYTSNKLKVYKIFKGSVQSEFIDVITMGGTVGTESIEASDLAILQKGEIGLFFCYPNSINLRNPVSNELMFDIYSSAQGVLRYDLQTKEADAPFASYKNIVNNLYPAVIEKTGRPYENKFPGFDAGTVPVVSNNVLGITSFSPANVAAGATENPALNLLTITGTDFGNPAGSAAILFDDANNGTGGTPFTVAYNDPLIVSWTTTQIQVRVPSRAGTGSFQVRDETSNTTTSPSALNVMYSVSSATFTFAGPVIMTKQSNLMNDNGSGGYTIVYSTSTAGGGVDLDASPVKATFQRALNTWKEIKGLNVLEGGTTSTQVVNPGDGNNTIMFDNTNTGNAPLAAGVLGTCYSLTSACGSGFSYRKTEFDIVIRNNGVSSGSTSFENGPCYPATANIDMETVLLHELGHALNLGHINDSYQGSFLPNINPGKIMHYAVLNGVARKSPDWSANIAAQYCINPKGLSYGSCTSFNTEMTPLASTTEAKDECPAFPGTATADNTFISFDLVHATSNKNTDPQYTSINCAGTGTGVTNTAYYAIRTGSGSSITMTVSGYSTNPVAQASCGSAGVELALYQVSSCPAGQAFPAPITCRTFNADGPLTAFTGLSPNTNYLIFVDGRDNTKANFSILLNGSALPVRIIQFNGTAKTAYNELSWQVQVSGAVKNISLESSADGRNYSAIYASAIAAGTETINQNFKDHSVLEREYYRLKYTNEDGSTGYSNILLLQRNKTGISISPNPAADFVNISLFSDKAADIHISLHDVTGKKLLEHKQVAAAGNQTIQLNGLSKYPKGNYLLRVWDGQKINLGKITIQ
ncbi:MAG: zinc-dependent metalloprotease [Ferruginibacter sp.]